MIDNDKKPIFYRVKKETKLWTPCFLCDEQNGLVNIKSQKDIDCCYQGIWCSKKEVEIKERKS